MKTRLKLNQINFVNIEKKAMRCILGGEKLCLASCHLGADEAAGLEYAHNRLNPPQQEIK